MSGASEGWLVHNRQNGSTIRIVGTPNSNPVYCCHLQMSRLRVFKKQSMQTCLRCSGSLKLAARASVSGTVMGCDVVGPQCAPIDM